MHCGSCVIDYNYLSKQKRNPYIMDTKPLPYLKMYICALDEFPDYMVPTLVAHSVLGAHAKFEHSLDLYTEWLRVSFRKVVV